MKLLNYMAAGKPIVSCRSSDDILEDGINALLAEDRNPGSFADKLRQLANDKMLAESLGKAARKTVENQYTWPARIESLRRFIRRVRALPGKRKNSPANN